MIPNSTATRTMTSTLRYDWTEAELQELYELPLTELIYRAQEVHREYHNPTEVQKCALFSIKTGGCPEDCAYCPQSAHYTTDVAATPLADVNTVLEAAERAKANGAQRFCMGAAWRRPRNRKDFDHVLELVRRISALGLETCCTLGMLTEEQAKRLAEAGLTAYNHNLDTSPTYYPKIISTRTYEDRLATLKHVRNAGLQICCGGIIGMGESIADRVALIAVLASQKPHPESVPINALVRVKGTPLAHLPPIDTFSMVRTIAVARIAMPKSKVRLSAGRREMTDEAQALCFLAGANSIFIGEKLLTTPNPAPDRDTALFEKLGLH